MLRVKFQVAPLNNLLQNVIGEDIGFIEPGNIGILSTGRQETNLS